MEASPFYGPSLDALPTYTYIIYIYIGGPFPVYIYIYICGKDLSLLCDQMAF